MLQFEYKSVLINGKDIDDVSDNLNYHDHINNLCRYIAHGKSWNTITIKSLGG